MSWYRHVFTAPAYRLEKLQVLEWVHLKCCLPELFPALGFSDQKHLLDLRLSAG